FSFGAVLYEMATGMLPFRGDTTALIFNAILERAPIPPIRLNPDLPSKLADIIIRALEKDRNLRYQHASDMRAELQRLKRDTESGQSAASLSTAPGQSDSSSSSALQIPVSVPTTKSSRNIAIVAAFAVVLIGGLGGEYYSRNQSAGPANNKQISQLNQPVNSAILAPGGHTVAFTAPVGSIGQVFVMLASGGEPLQLTTDPRDKSLDSFSQDGTQIYYDVNFGNSEVWSVPTLGGTPTRVVSGVGLVTSTDGLLFYGKPEKDAIFRKSKSSIEEEPIYSFAGQGLTIWGILLFPDGKELLIPASTNQINASTVVIYKVNVSAHTADKIAELNGSPTGFVWDDPGRTLFFSRMVNGVTNLWEYSFAGGGLKQVTFGAGPDLSPMPAPTGKGIYFINGKLSGALTSFSTRTKQSVDVVTQNATQPLLSWDGHHLAYLTLAGNGRQELWLSDLNGNNKVKLASSESLLTLAGSPDNSQFALAEQMGGGGKVYISRADGSGLRQLPWSGAYVGTATWSRDGKTLYFSGNERDPTKFTTWQASTDGSKVETLSEGCGAVYDTSQDDRYLLAEEAPTGISVLSPGDKKCTPLLPDIAASMIRFSLDGNSILYPAASHGQMAIYRQPWRDGKISGSAQLAVKLPFAFRQMYGGNAYDFSKDLSTIIYARPSGQADLYYLSQR